MELHVDNQLAAVERSVSSFERDGQPARAVTLARSYATTAVSYTHLTLPTKRIV